jgi:hypothetical protein
VTQSCSVSGLLVCSKNVGVSSNTHKTTTYPAKTHFFSSLNMVTGINRLQSFAREKKRQHQQEQESQAAEDLQRNTPPSDIISIKSELRVAQHERDTICRESRSFRDKYLERQADAEAIYWNKDKSDILKNILRQENAQSMWKKLLTLKPQRRSKGMTSVKVPASWPTHDAGFAVPIENPKTCSDWKTVDTPKEMLYYLMKRNQLHFGQAQGTPFTIEPMSVMFNWSANTATAEQVLRGNFSSSELTHLQQLLLQHCKREFDPGPPDAQSIPAIITTEWKRRIRRWKESTTTSPSGLHLGHARALISQHSHDPNSPEGKQLSKIQDGLIQAQVSLLNYSITHGHAYARWKNVVNVMIEKDLGDVHIHRLCVTHLYEHDFGLFLALYWKQMLRKLEARGTINAGQYGGRAGTEAQSLVFLEEIKTGICYLSQKSLVNFDNNAASCYDRIIPSLASLIGKKKGLLEDTPTFLKHTSNPETEQDWVTCTT